MPARRMTALASPVKGAQPARGRPSRLAAQELSRHILDAALARFRKQGFSATTIDQIAADCKTAKHSIYRRFASKEALFSAAVRRDRESFLARLQHVDCLAGDPLAAAQDLCRQLLDIMLQPGVIDLYRMSIAEAPRFPVIAREFHEGADAIAGLLSPVVRRGQEAGAIRAGEPDMIARHVFHAVTAQALHFLLLGDRRLEDQRQRAAYFATHWQLVVQGVK